MIELIISFLLSIGWLNVDQVVNTTVIQQDASTYGIVSTDDVGSRQVTVKLSPKMDGGFIIQ